MPLNLKAEYLSETQYFNICNLCVYNFFSIFATYFCVSHSRDAGGKEELKTYNMAFAVSRMFMKYNLLNTSLFASCMCKVERHKSIED